MRAATTAKRRQLRSLSIMGGSLGLGLGLGVAGQAGEGAATLFGLAVLAAISAAAFQQTLP